jgi:hypothetical protein
VAVRELAFIGMLGEHVAVFDVDGFADAERHGEGGIGRVEREGGTADWLWLLRRGGDVNVWSSES